MIIHEVIANGRKLRKVCESIGVNVSSGKNIIAIYKREGRVLKKKHRASFPVSQKKESLQNLDQQIRQDSLGKLSSCNLAQEFPPNSSLETILQGYGYCSCPISNLYFPYYGN